MPYPNEHAVRMVSPGRFQRGSFRRIRITAGVSAIIGKLKGQKDTTVQAYRFAKSQFTVAQARAWLSKEKKRPIRFEAAAATTTEKQRQI